MHNRSGYVLLTVLLLLALAAVALGSVCRSAVQRSLQSSSAADELQRRWGRLSCRYTLLPAADNLLDDRGPDGLPVTRRHADFSLTSTRFSIDLVDEQAKVNVNALYAVLGKDRAQTAAAVLAASGGSGARPHFRLTVRSEPRRSAPSTDGQTETPPDVGDRYPAVFGSLSEIFPGTEPADVWPGTRGSVSTNLTCWGSGRLNLRRAPAGSIAQACAPLLSPAQISQLMAQRNGLGDNPDLGNLLALVHVSMPDTFKLSDRLTVTSAVYTLWVAASDRSGTDREMTVRDATVADDVRCFIFRW